MTPSNNIVEDTIKERGQVYGDPYESHVNIGIAWTGLLRQAGILKPGIRIKASTVAQMMVVFKMQRSAIVFKDDNYIDGHAYMNFAEQFQDKERKIKDVLD